MLNKFKNIRVAINTTHQEKNGDGTVQKKKRGRPKSPDMQPMTLRIDKILHLELKKQARLLGIGKSALISMALKSYFSKKEKKYRLVEI